MIQLGVLGFVLWYGQPPKDTYYSAMIDKLDRLQSTEGPRLIIIGGSNAAFGIDSTRVADQLDAEPVNLSLHAAVGSEIYFRIVEESVRAGDVVVVIPEYEFIRGIENETIKSDMVTACPEVKTFIDSKQTKWEQAKRIMDVDALQRLHNYTYHAFRKKRAGVGVYHRESFNEYGDMIGHHHADPSDKVDFGPLGWEEEPAQDFVKRLNEFYAHCTNAGAEVYYSFAPLNRSRFEASADVLDKLEQLYASQLRIPLLDLPSDNVFDESEFFDTFYHLNQQATIRRSERINQALTRRIVARQSQAGKWK